MAWHFTEFYKAVYDRFTGDSTLTGLLGGSYIYSVRAPDARKTYIVTNVQAAGIQDEAFRTLVRTYRLAVTIIQPNEVVGNTDPLDLQGQIAARVEGNWYAKTFGTAPDYGLARWTPTLASWGCTPVELIDIQTLDGGDNRLALGMAFEVRITKDGA